MKRFMTVLSVAFFQFASAGQVTYAPHEGDFVFQSLPHGDLVDAIEGASHSKYSHVGLVIRKNNEWYVREAIGPVIDTPFNDWINRGRAKHGFDAYRLRQPLEALVPDLIKASEVFLGRPYDFRYRMDDDAIYCSELLYKSMLSASGLRLGKLQRLGELDWRPYRATIEKYEGGKVPEDRLMITPKSLSQAAALYVVHQGIPSSPGKH